MDIKKNLKDYKLSNKQRIFASYINEKIMSYTCSEQIKNKDYIRHYFSPDNDFLIYSTAVNDPSRLTKKYPPIYNDDEPNLG